MSLCLVRVLVLVTEFLMPVDAIQPYQIVIMVAFLLLLMVALLIVRRFRGGLSKHIHRAKRMRHIEDMALTPYPAVAPC